MEKIFELITEPGKEEGKKTEVRLGITIKLSSFETTCFVTQPCQSYRALESEVQGIRQNLEDVLKDARQFFEGSSRKDKLGLRTDMNAGEIWAILCMISD